jgi:Ca2+-transporting ATPase
MQATCEAVGHGLTSAEARRRLDAEGPNELLDAGSRGFWRIALDVLQEPMFALLVAGGLIYLMLGDLAEALILLVFAMLSVAITVVQESRTERVLEALRDLTSPRALVIRDGVRVRVPGREVVRGDVVSLSEGDRAPADAMLTEASGLEMDESLLTGESVPVRKQPAPDPNVYAPSSPGGDDRPEIYSGSVAVRGSGLAIVTATGPRSEIGKIGGSLARIEPEPSRLRLETRRLARLTAVLGGGFSLAAVLLYGFTRGGWLEAILSGIALGMAMLPEEFPVVLTVFMAMGAWRISKARVLTRRSAAIETLGAATVLCTDKTGTLTENRMAIDRLWTPSGGFVDALGESLPPVKAGHDLVSIGRLASAAEPFDPMEKAFHALAGRVAEPSWRIEKSYALSPALLTMTQLWNRGPAATHLAAAKGAPEAVARLAHLEGADLAEIAKAADAMAARGLRVLGVAAAEWSGAGVPDEQTGFQFAFLGLVGLADPLRTSVPDAVRDCHRAGIRVVMITGDYPATAREIARRAGLEGGAVTTGAELAALDDAALQERVGATTIFARIAPEQKLRIVEALKARGEIVAMTGDGVNDAPSLKAAHIGVAMGGRGTDVAREASSIVLLDDDFGSIVKAIRLGRRIYDNLRKVMGFIISVHVPIAGMALLPLVFGLPILFTPVHIAFLETVIDPVCSLVFEAEEDERDVMARPPRPPDQPLTPLSFIGRAALQGAIAFLPALVLVAIAVSRGAPPDEIRALAFFALVLSIVSLIFVHRAFDASLRSAFTRPNRALLGVLFVIAAVLALTLFWPPASALFRFGPLHADDLTMVGLGALGVLLGLEALKAIGLRAGVAAARR